VTQETFARAYDRFSAYDPNRPITGWLHTIASHLAIDHVRRARVRRWFGLGAPRVIGFEDQEDAITRVAEQDLVSDLLDGLPARTRAMLVLRHAYGYDDRSISKLVGTSPENVRTQISRAHQRLRSILGAPGADLAGGRASREGGKLDGR
jgi:RNA polymerase sigma-70 factor (ECF subfamily)